MRRPDESAHDPFRSRIRTVIPALALCFLAALSLDSCSSPPAYRLSGQALRGPGNPDTRDLTPPYPHAVRGAAKTLASLYGGSFRYELYEPANAVPVATVFVVHGFARDLASMRGWGELLAGHGLRAVVPSLRNSTPFSGRHDRNARDLAMLAHAFQAEPGGDLRLYMGFSAGGLASLLAFLDDNEAIAWLGLDPVDSRGLAAEALDSLPPERAARLASRCFALLGEPSRCNGGGNFEPLLDRVGIPWLRVEAAAHGAFELPYDRRIEAICGTTEPAEALGVVLRAIRSEALRFMLDKAVYHLPEH